MHRWTGGSRSRGEDTRQVARRGFFSAEDTRPAIVPGPPAARQLSALTDATNRAVRELTAKQVQRSVDAQALRWAVRSPPSQSNERQRKKARVEEPPPAVGVLDVSPISGPGDTSILEAPLDFSGEHLHLLSPLDPQMQTLPFVADTDGTAAGWIDQSPAPPLAFYTGRELLAFTPGQHWGPVQHGPPPSAFEPHSAFPVAVHGACGVSYAPAPLPDLFPQLPPQRPAGQVNVIGSFAPPPPHSSSAVPWDFDQPSVRGPGANPFTTPPFFASSSSHAPWPGHHAPGFPAGQQNLTFTPFLLPNPPPPYFSGA